MRAQPPQATGSRLHPIRSETSLRRYPSRATTQEPNKSHFGWHGAFISRRVLRAFFAVAVPGYDMGIVGHKGTAGIFADRPRTRVTRHGATAGDDSFEDRGHGCP